MHTESPAIPPKIRQPLRWPRVAAGVAIGLALLSGGGVLFLFNPSTHRFYPECAFHEVTGLNCPTCGGTRAAYALLHGRIRTALRDNALLVLLLPAAAVRGVWWGLKKRKGHAVGPFLPTKSLWWLLALAVIFAVLRNLPAFAFLSP